MPFAVCGFPEAKSAAAGLRPDDAVHAGIMVGLLRLKQIRVMPGGAKNIFERRV